MVLALKLDISYFKFQYIRTHKQNCQSIKSSGIVSMVNIIKHYRLNTILTLYPFIDRMWTECRLCQDCGVEDVEPTNRWIPGMCNDPGCAILSLSLGMITVDIKEISGHSFRYEFDYQTWHDLKMFESIMFGIQCDLIVFRIPSQSVNMQFLPLTYIRP